jgi:hypothetical protein
MDQGLQLQGQQTGAATKVKHIKGGGVGHSSQDGICHVLGQLDPLRSLVPLFGVLIKITVFSAHRSTFLVEDVPGVRQQGNQLQKSCKPIALISQESRGKKTRLIKTAGYEARHIVNTTFLQKWQSLPRHDP